jgi:H/ACA ribonucleoprotein complex subunit 3
VTVLLHRCGSCKEYTLATVCPHCGGAAVPNRPAKFSPEDRYGDYRRRLRKETGSASAPMRRKE